MMTMGSLFDGISGFPLGASRYGIVTLWASEIEKFPIMVSSARFPDMLQFGDITKLDGANLPPVDIIAGGSPCQDLSVASGNRAGLSGARSGLFMEQVRIVKEMRNADILRGRTALTARPRYLLWENVPGAFSTGTPHGEDFRIVLEEICKVVDGTAAVPRPAGGVWLSAGTIMGNGFSVAFRVMDAQFFGVPQRRRRIYLVADYGGASAPQILFEQDRLLGDTEEGGKTRQGAAAAAQAGVGNPSGDCMTPWDVQSRRIFSVESVWPTLYGGEGGGHGYVSSAGFCAGAGASAGGIGYSPELAPTLKASQSGNMMPSVLCLNDQGGQRIDLSEDVSGTLRTQEHGHQPLIYENHGIDSRYTGPHAVVPTLSARAGTGGNNLPMVVEPEESICISGNIVGREVKNGGNGIGYQKGIAYTLTGADRLSGIPDKRSYPED